MLKYFFCFICMVILLLAARVAALPPPAEYTMDMLKQDLQSAHLVALCEVLDTVSVDLGGSPLPVIERRVTFKVVECYKGGVSDSTLLSRRNLNLVGGYAEYYEIGLKTIVCFYDGYKDGVYLMVNPRGKFDITDQDSVTPPPVGRGFSDEFNYRKTSAAFKGLVTETIRANEFIQFFPVLPKEDQAVTFKTSIDLSGGAQLLYTALDHQAGSPYITFRLTWQPCTSQVCPTIYLVVDTALTLGTLAPGSYSAYRAELLPPQSAVIPTDSVRFTVYAAAGIEEGPRSGMAEAKLSVCPNPFSSRTIIQVQRRQKPEDRSQNWTLEIFNMQGQLVDILTADLCPLSSGFSWNAQDLPNGIYILKGIFGNRHYSRKLILSR